jgi:hypothetical protein
MVLANALYKASLEMDQTYNPATGHILPELPLHRARFIMTRSDFIRKHHDLSIFSIDSHAMVRADSVRFAPNLDLKTSSKRRWSALEISRAWAGRRS